MAGAGPNLTVNGKTLQEGKKKKETSLEKRKQLSVELFSGGLKRPIPQTVEIKVRN